MPLAAAMIITLLGFPYYPLTGEPIPFWAWVKAIVAAVFTIVAWVLYALPYIH
jgi:hypothetical protein